MFKLLGKIPKQEVVVALSGGVDSIAVFNFVKNTRNVLPIFIHHNTDTSEKAYNFLKEKYNVNVYYINNSKQADESWQEFWRNERYKFLNSIKLPVITAHTLDDCVETYLWYMLNGKDKTIPYKTNNVVRPFLLVRKHQLIDYCVKRSLTWIEDESNNDTKYMRNHIRHKVLPEAIKVNPGLYKVVARKVFDNYSVVAQ